jgi:hypothetical protein
MYALFDELFPRQQELHAERYSFRSTCSRANVRVDMNPFMSSQVKEAPF